MPISSPGTLKGVADRVDYLAELGVTYLHLMPLLKPRPGQNDGGYAVMDYRAVREDLGTIDDLRELATVLRSQGISLTLDLVLNHVAAEHQWAVNARAGDPLLSELLPHVRRPGAARTRTSETLPEVFPDFAPGNFTYDEESSFLGLDDVQHRGNGISTGTTRKSSTSSQT